MCGRNVWLLAARPDALLRPPRLQGCICDEMGLGKTVELLALVLANRFMGPSPSFDAGPAASKRRRKERIECVCGVADAAPASEGGYAGLWLCCDECDAWAHGACVGFPRRPPPGE